MWWVLIAILVVLGVLLWAFNRWSKGVEDDLSGIGWKNTPLFGFVRQRVEQRERDNSGPGRE